MHLHFLEVVATDHGFFCGDVCVYEVQPCFLREMGSGDGRSSNTNSTGEVGGLSNMISRSIFCDIQGTARFVEGYELDRRLFNTNSAGENFQHDF